jgi:hypothetical protein
MSGVVIPPGAIPGEPPEEDIVEIVFVVAAIEPRWHFAQFATAELSPKKKGPFMGTVAGDRGIPPPS